MSDALGAPGRIRTFLLPICGGQCAFPVRTVRSPHVSKGSRQCRRIRPVLFSNQATGRECYPCINVASAVISGNDITGNKARGAVRCDGREDDPVGGGADGHDPDNFHGRAFRRPRTRHHVKDHGPARPKYSPRKTRMARAAGLISIDVIPLFSQLTGRVITLKSPVFNEAVFVLRCF